MLQQLSYTCHSAFEVLGQHEAVVLRQQNAALRVELFNTTMPSFATVVRSFNDSLLDLFKDGEISFEIGLAYAGNPDEFALSARGMVREVETGRGIKGISVTYGGKHPAEIAFGRRPPDILGLESLTAQQLASEAKQESSGSPREMDAMRRQFMESQYQIRKDYYQ